MQYINFKKKNLHLDNGTELRALISIVVIHYIIKSMICHLFTYQKIRSSKGWFISHRPILYRNMNCIFHRKKGNHRRWARIWIYKFTKNDKWSNCALPLSKATLLCAGNGCLCKPLFLYFANSPLHLQIHNYTYEASLQIL